MSPMVKCYSLRMCGMVKFSFLLSSLGLGLVSYSAFYDSITAYEENLARNALQEELDRLQRFAARYTYKRFGPSTDIWPYDAEAAQKTRLKRVDKACLAQNATLWTGPSLDSYSGLVADEVFRNHIIVDDLHQVLYCFVPKASCTNWKRLLRLLSGNTWTTDPLEIERDEIKGYVGLDIMRFMEPHDMIMRLEEYTKFMFVRDPLDRLVSAYVDKLTGSTESSKKFMKAFGKDIQRRYRRNKIGERDPDGNGTTFAELARFVVDHPWTDINWRNDHWEKMTRLCRPCSARYDYIGKVEHIISDSSYLLSLIGASQNISYPAHQPSVSAPHFEEYLGQVPPPLLEQLQTAFDDDFAMFDYRKMVPR